MCYHTKCDLFHNKYPYSTSIQTDSIEHFITVSKGPWKAFGLPSCVASSRYRNSPWTWRLIIGVFEKNYTTIWRHPKRTTTCLTWQPASSNGNRPKEIEMLFPADFFQQCQPPAIEQFPQPLMDKKARQKGGVIIHIAVALYMFLGLAIVCDDYFVPALDKISEGEQKLYISRLHF